MEAPSPDTIAGWAHIDTATITRVLPCYGMLGEEGDALGRGGFAAGSQGPARRGSNQVDGMVVRVRVMEGRGMKVWVREVGAEKRGTEA